MLTREENQILINKFVEKNVDAINTLESSKQKAVLDAIIMIQNKFGTIKQPTFKDDAPKKPKRVVNQRVTSSKTTTTTEAPTQIPTPSTSRKEEELPFKVGDELLDNVTRETFKITNINDKSGSVFLELNGGRTGITNKITIIENLQNGSWKFVIGEAPTQISTPPSSSKEEEIKDLEDAIDTQKLLLTLADTNEEKDEIKSLLKDLRGQLKKLKK